MYPQRAHNRPFCSMSGWVVISGLFMALCGLPVSVGAAVTTFIAGDYAFTGPEQLDSGRQTVRLINRGRDLSLIHI